MSHLSLTTGRVPASVGESSNHKRKTLRDRAKLGTITRPSQARHHINQPPPHRRRHWSVNKRRTHGEIHRPRLQALPSRGHETLPEGRALPHQEVRYRAASVPPGSVGTRTPLDSALLGEAA